MNLPRITTYQRDEFATLPMNLREWTMVDTVTEDGTPTGRREVTELRVRMLPDERRAVQRVIGTVEGAWFLCPDNAENPASPVKD